MMFIPKRLHLAGIGLSFAILIGACTAPTSPGVIPLNASPTSIAPRQTVALLPSRTPTQAFTPTATSAQPNATVLSQMRGAQWSQTARGLTAGMFLNPYPPDLGGTTTYRVNLVDASGQPITDATVELSIIAGMVAMEGEHDEKFDLKLTHQGNGAYSIGSSVSGTNQALTGMMLTIKRGGQVWELQISKSDLPAK